MEWHLENIDNVLGEVKSSLQGLTSSEAKTRLEAIGPNEIVAGKKKSAGLIFLKQFGDFMIIVLIVTAILSGFLGDITDTIVIIAIVLLNAMIGFMQEYRAERSMEALKKLALPHAVVIRDATPCTVASSSVVPGDVVELRAGDVIAADARIVTAVNLEIDESTLTGESLPVGKQTGPLPGGNISLGDYTNMAFKGTFITNGHGKGVVVATGMKTEMGKIAAMLQVPDMQTPLQKRLKVFGKRLAYVIFFICFMVFTAGYLRGESAVVMLLTALSLAVAAIPEALPAVITIALATAAKKMAKKNALIRKLPAVETLGSVSYICTDKTGTLTLNRMSVEQFAGRTFYGKHFKDQFPGRKDYVELMQAIALNNNAHRNDNGYAVGDPTETALREFARGHGFDRKKIETDFPRIAEIPFDSTRKCMTTVHEHDGRYLSITKGAPEVLLKSIAPGTDISFWQEAVDVMLDKGLRVLGFAVRPLPVLPARIVPSEIEKDLQFIGIAGIIDPPRKEAIQAVNECKTAGIKPVMISGDHPATAATIARRIGIISSSQDRVLSGAELRELGSAQLLREAGNIKVYARVSPEQKLNIVQALQQQGEYVAMTGDGINDAPALKHADIGVAMGINGTDVSKEAADMILLDDNFATIVNAIKEGRRIYDNIRKFIRYVLTGNTAEILTILLAPLLGLPVPLLPIHILWINLVTDGLPGLALATERAEKNIMRRKPRKPDESIFSHGLGTHVLWTGSLLAALTIGVQAYSIFIKDTHWQTIVFTVLCLGQLFYAMAARSESTSIWKLGLFSNLRLMLALTITFLLQIGIIYLPALNRLFHTQPLNLPELIVCLAIPFFLLVIVELEKMTRKTIRSKD